MIYKQSTPMQWITFYYNGNDPEKVAQSKERGLQMTRKIRYSNVIEEIREEELQTLSDTKEHYAGITRSGLIVMFENNY
ncbi:hypothetical protein [Oceanobacillus oncorhynchi]|uniref:hypothetical protein n=1 Tax=Oceanobacillus oncorhynchi TaxID=545501 RepID=UPI0034D58D5B